MRVVTPLGCRRFFGQFLEGQHWCRDHMTQSVDKQIGAVPAIEAKLHLFQVGSEMLGADAVPRSSNPTLEQRESGFHGVGVNVAHDVYARTVVNLFVVGSLCFAHRGFVGRCVVSENDFHILTDILADVSGERSSFRIVRVEEPEIAVALADTDNHFLVVEFSDLSLVAIPATDVGHVHLDFAVEHGLVGLRHCVPDTMAEIPRCFVASDSERTLNLAGRNSLFRFAEQERCDKPLDEREMRVVEYRASSDGKLIVAVFAVEQLLLCFQFNRWSLTADALRAFRPAETGQELAALVVGTERSMYIH